MPVKSIHILEKSNIFKILFQYATVGIMVIGKKGVIKLANPFAEKLFGYDEGKLSREKLDALIPNGLKETHIAHHAGYFKNPKERKMGIGMDLFAKRLDGTLFPVEISLGHFEAEGETFAIVYITDISVRKANEDAILKSEKKYRFVFENSKDVRAIYELVFDKDGKVVNLIIKEVNTVYKEIMIKGGLKGECEGRLLTEMPGDYSMHFKECERAVKNVEVVKYTHYNPVTNWYMLITIVPIDASHCFAYGIDITAQKKNEHELNELNKKLENKVQERTEALVKVVRELAQSKEELIKSLGKEKELNELKSRFITTASHEFRTPLAAILSSAAIIEKYNEKEEKPKRKKHLERIESSVKNLTEILNDFLSLGKLEEGAVPYKPEPLQVGEFVRTVVQDNNGILKKDQKINYRHIDGNHNAETDLQMLKNIILNLLSNAVKYSKEGQTIDITTQVIDGSIELRVKDYGIGIPDADQKHLFTRFFRAKNAVNIEGTGLGLNIVKKYVELMNGNISFASELEKGSEFVVLIPIKYQKNKSSEVVT